VNDLFRKFAHKTPAIVGSPWAFILATAVIVVWAIAGPIFTSPTPGS
jgi:low affinity Fe/Cu permease